MSVLADTLARRDEARATAVRNAALIVIGSLFVAVLAQLSIPLPFTPVPITGQTLGVVLVGASLGATRGGAALLLYLAEGAAGLPVFAEGKGGVPLLTPAYPTGGYLWGFVVAAVVVGLLAERGWDRNLGSAIGAMLIGNVVIYLVGLPWLANAVHVPAAEAMKLGLYPFVVGDLLKLSMAAALLPTAWRLVGGAGTVPPRG